MGRVAGVRKLDWRPGQSKPVKISVVVPKGAEVKESCPVTLIIQHIRDTQPPTFHLLGSGSFRESGPVVVPSPSGFPVKGRPHSDMMRELRWYLEDFLEYPYEPEVSHANRVKEALRDWGKEVFAAFFGRRRMIAIFGDTIGPGNRDVRLIVSSDDPGVLSWPWEAMRSPKGVCVGQNCQVERRLNKTYKTMKIARTLPRDSLNILLIIARPFRRDVKYRAVSRSLVALAQKPIVPVNVHLLRPPTFRNLREHLKERKHWYHIVHCDMHGGFTDSGGFLVFESGRKQPQNISAEQISALLSDLDIPVVVLNACRSGMLDESACDPFASVAASLVKSGIVSVVAMSHSLFVSGAQVFVPTFYHQLFETGSVAEAVYAGRRRMLTNPSQLCPRGRFDLEDWIVPVLYQQQLLEFPFVRTSEAREDETKSKVARELRNERSPYGFVGRDRVILELERAMRQEAPCILIHGLGGVGKTALAAAFLEW